MAGGRSLHGRYSGSGFRTSGAALAFGTVVTDTGDISSPARARFVVRAHVSLDRPSIHEEEATITAFGKLGVEVAISELDIDVLPKATRQQTADVSLNVAQDPALNPYTGGLPDDVQQQLARRYRDLFHVYLKHRDIVTRITLWGVTDADSWLNNWPVRGRTSYPLLFDRSGNPKPAFNAVFSAAKETK